MFTRLGLDFLRLCLWLLLIMMVFVPLERICALRRQRLLREGFVIDLGYYFLNSLLPETHSDCPDGPGRLCSASPDPDRRSTRASRLSRGIRFAGALAIGELGFYWGHRWSHEIPFLWRFHAIHHTAEEMDWLVATRAHPVDMVFTRLCGVIPIYVLGLSQPARGTLDYVSLLVIFSSTLWGFFIHANLRWRLRPRPVAVDDAGPFHHWHHTYDEPLNKNFSAMLPWMDRLFGTYYAPKVTVAIEVRN